MSGPSSLWSALKRWRDQQTIKRRPIPDALWAMNLARFPFLGKLSVADRHLLRELSTLFLARKQFYGVSELVVTDDMAVAIAAQACLPILHLGLDWYDAFVGIVVHATEVVAMRETMDEAGIVHRYRETLTGEAMGGGPVTLSWKDVADAADSAAWGYNVVIHEFAHILDMRDGVADGVPPLASREAHQQWVQVMETHYQDFCERLDRGESTLLDPYGAEAPSEFFAVACEAFFVSPQNLLGAHEELYGLLSQFFKQDPAKDGVLQ